MISVREAVAPSCNHLTVVLCVAQEILYCFFDLVEPFRLS